MALEMEPVVSTNIAAVGHDPDTGDLRVEFMSGAIYSYAGVDQSTAENLKASPSPGSYFARHIKNRYPTRQL